MNYLEAIHKMANTSGKSQHYFTRSKDSKRLFMCVCFKRKMAITVSSANKYNQNRFVNNKPINKIAKITSNLKQHLSF